jgi:hypothetical protein
MHGTSATARAHSELHAKSHRLSKRPPFECIALVWQRGRRASAYQAGAATGILLVASRVAVQGAEAVTPNFCGRY